MRNRYKSCYIALVSIAMILMLVNIVSADPFVYISNSQANTISVIDVSTQNITAKVNVGTHPIGVAVTPDRTKVYVTNSGDNPGDVSVIDTNASNATYNQVIATVPVGDYPWGVAVSPNGSNVYVTNEESNTVSVINTSTNIVTATVNVGNAPCGIVVTPDGKKVYVTNAGDTPGDVSVIDTNVSNATYNQVIATVTIIGKQPFAISVTADGSQVNVINGDGSTTVIDTATNTIVYT